MKTMTTNSFFSGFDSFSGQVLPPLLTGTTSNGTNQQQISYQLCESLEDLSQFLNASTELKADGQLGAGSLKAEFIKKLKMNTHSVVLAVHVTNGQIFNTSNPSYPSSWSAPDLKNFFEQYGDSYVNSITVGSELIVTYVFDAQTRDEQKSVVSSLNANGVSKLGKVSADFQGEINNAVQSIKTSCQFNYYMMGIDNGNQPTSIDQNNWVQFALTSATKPTQNPGVIGFTTAPYPFTSTLTQAYFQPLLNSVKLWDHLAHSLNQVEKLNNQIQKIQSIYKKYGYSLDSLMETNATIVKNDLLTLKTLQTHLNDDPTQVYSNPTLNSLTLGSPSMNVTGKAHLIGNAKGGAYFDNVMPSKSKWLEDETVLSSVSATSGWYLNTMTFNYNNESGGISITKGSETGPNSGGSLELAENERIVEVSSEWGDDMNSITILTNLNSSVVLAGSKPNGGNQGQWKASQDLTNQKQTVFLGFIGYSGSQMGGIGVHEGTFYPASWS